MSPTAAQDERQVRARLTRRVRSGASWFFWIAGLSLVNVLAFVFAGDWGAVVGLGASEVFHSLAHAAEIEGGAPIPGVFAFAIVADLFAAGVLAVAGLFARRRIGMAFPTGMALYAADGALCLYASEPLGAAFHFFALAGICFGYDALRRLERLDRSADDVATAAA